MEPGISGKRLALVVPTLNEAGNIVRILPQVTLALLNKYLHVTDPMSGFFVIRRPCIEGLSFQTTGFKLLLEILVRGRIRSAAEVPYHFGLRHTGTSKASAAVALHYLHLLGRLSRDVVLRSSEQ